MYTPNVDENAGPNTLVTTVVASDKDGDNVRFGFVGGGTTSGQFVIEEITGVIRLQGQVQSIRLFILWIFTFFCSMSMSVYVCITY